MSQNNEITIMKSSGISLYKMMTAPIIAFALVAYGLIVFNNDVLPDANHQAKILMQDISRQKPTLSLEPGVFSQEVSNYAILVRGMDKQSNKIYDVTIYNYTNPNRVNVVTAEQGNIYFAGDKTKLIMDLENGEIHQNDDAHLDYYRKLVFKKHRIAMNADQFAFQSSGTTTARGQRELSANDMSIIVDSLKKELNQNIQTTNNEINKFFYKDKISPYNNLGYNSAALVLKYRISEKVKMARNVILSNLQRVEISKEDVNSFNVEIYKKYSLPVACLIFVLIGAPLGIMIRKGGFGVAAGISLFFFLIYWAFLIGGEKLADRNIITPFWGMWGANVFMGIIGSYITYKAMMDSMTLDFSWMQKIIPKFLKEAFGNKTEEPTA